MTSIRLRSSSLLAVAYQPEQEWLRVEFVRGEVYGYSGVPEVVYHDLLRAESKGRYFNQWIRDRFPYEKVLPSENYMALASQAASECGQPTVSGTGDACSTPA